MPSGVSGTGPYSTLLTTLDDRLIKDFYQQHRVEGRAVLMGGEEEPAAWLTQPDPDRDEFCLCWARRDGIVFTPGDAALRSLSRKVRVRRPR